MLRTVPKYDSDKQSRFKKVFPLRHSKLKRLSANPSGFAGKIRVRYKK